MAIRSLKTGQFSRSALVGNPVIMPGSYESIATATGSGATSITFSSIPQTYSHLQIRYIARSTGSGTGRDLNVTVNGATSAGDYKSHYLIGNGASATAGADAAGTTASMWLGNPPASGSTASIFSAGIIDILDYTSTNKNKTFRVLAGVDTNNNTYGNIFLASGLRLSTTTISSITLTLSVGNFETGSSFALYGVN